MTFFSCFMLMLNSALQYAYGVAYFGVIACVVFLGFKGVHNLLVSQQWVHSMWQSLGVWLVMGTVCALFWPIWYRKEMKGHWRGAFPCIALISLTGPFAIVLGIPL